MNNCGINNQSANKTLLISIGINGQGDNASYPVAISANGRYVAFRSLASNLVNNDTNGSEDAFVRDLLTKVTTRVSLGQNNVEGNDDSFPTGISADGRYVVFESYASNLVADDTNGNPDIFVRDLVNKTTTRVNVSSTGVEGNSESSTSVISADGRYIAFSSSSTNLIDGASTHYAQSYIHDRTTKTTKLISKGPGGVDGNNNSRPTAISADGRFVAFWSLASNLVSGDSNGYQDAFVRDTVNNITSRVSLGPNGSQSNGWSSPTAISADGRFVAFQSSASNLVASTFYELLKAAYIHDRTTKITTRVSIGPAHVEGNEESNPSAISADGRYVGMSSYATNLIANDTNYTWDVFVHDQLLDTSKAADLGVIVTTSPLSVAVGQTANYTLTIKNNGAAGAASVTLTDAILNGSINSIAPSQGTCSAAAISVCRIGDLASGASVTVKIGIKANGNPLNQLVSVNAAQKDGNLINNRITVSTKVTP